MQMHYDLGIAFSRFYLKHFNCMVIRTLCMTYNRKGRYKGVHKQLTDMKVEITYDIHRISFLKNGRHLTITRSC